MEGNDEETGHRRFSAAPLIFARNRTARGVYLAKRERRIVCSLWIAGLIALVVGILIGFLLRNSSASAQIAAARAQIVTAQAEKALIEQRAAELTRDLSVAKSDLALAQTESAARAGFESLAVERGETIEQLRDDLQTKSDAERTLSAQVEGLKAELSAERDWQLEIGAAGKRQEGSVRPVPGSCRRHSRPEIEDLLRRQPEGIWNAARPAQNADQGIPRKG